MSATEAFKAAHFDAMFNASDDPWGFRSRWYEARKRALTLASLPERRYRSGFEPGCANGELSAALASRCDRFLAADVSTVALRQASRRLRHRAGVETRCLAVPQQWPEGSFDLIVLSEFVYYLPVDAIDRLATRVRSSLPDNGAVVACHWRHPIEGCELNGDQVHDRLDAGLGLHHVGRTLEADLRIDVWSASRLSPAAKEGLTSA